MGGISIKFYLNKAESELMKKIVDRAEKVFSGRERIDIYMDITACHCNGSPLDLKKLLVADDFNFIHDVAGIGWHIDKNTGKLNGRFLPRCSLPQSA